MLVACQWPLKRATQLPGSVWYGGLEAHWGYLHYVEYLTYKLYVCIRNAYQIRTTDNWEKPYFNTYLCSYIWSGKIAIAPFHHIYNRVCFALMSRKSIAMLGNTHECNIEDFFFIDSEDVAWLFQFQWHNPEVYGDINHYRTTKSDPGAIRFGTISDNRILIPTHAHTRSHQYNMC